MRKKIENTLLEKKSENRRSWKNCEPILHEKNL